MTTQTAAHAILALSILGLLSACDAPPCPQEQVTKATEAFGHCIEMEQQGDGGLAYGQMAYKTFCEAKQ